MCSPLMGGQKAKLWKSERPPCAKGAGAKGAWGIVGCKKVKAKQSLRHFLAKMPPPFAQGRQGLRASASKMVAAALVADCGRSKPRDQPQGGVSTRSREREQAPDGRLQNYGKSERPPCAKGAGATGAWGIVGCKKVKTKQSLRHFLAKMPPPFTQGRLGRTRLRVASSDCAAGRPIKSVLVRSRQYKGYARN